MHFHQNHCWCRNSNWTDGMFDATYMVSLEKWPDYQVGTPHNQQVISPDWTAVVQEVAFLSQDEYDRNAMIFERMLGKDGLPVTVTDEQLREMSMRSAPEPRAEVIEWLNENVAPVKNAQQPQGWCIGNRDYRYRGASGEMTFWFIRRRDAMAFIRRWSVYGRATTYLNYFKDDYRELKNGRLVQVERG